MPGEYRWSCCGKDMGSYERAQDAQSTGGFCILDYHLDNGKLLESYEYRNLQHSLEEMKWDCEKCRPEESENEASENSDEASKKKLDGDSDLDGPVNKKTKLLF